VNPFNPISPNPADIYKRQAAEAAVRYVESGMVVGLGHGSTAIHAIRKISDLLASGAFHNIRAVPTSNQVQRDAESLGIPLTTLNDCPELDLTIDGADEVDPALNLIKGGGGALLREKIVAQASRRVIIAIDHTKQSPLLGTHFPVPIEVLPFALQPVLNKLEKLAGTADLRRNADGQPFHTDQQNWIIDWHTGPLQDPHETARHLEQIAGILGHGLFLGMVERVIVAGPEGVKDLLRR
jgi:ribose 5-phosphate isomerase A